MAIDYEDYVKHFTVKNEDGDVVDVGIEASKIADSKEIEFGSGFNVIEGEDKVTVTADFMPSDTEVIKVVVSETAPTETIAKTLYLLVD